MIRTDTDAINQSRIARDNPQHKTAPIPRKARISTAINTIGLYETWEHPEFIVIGRSRATSHAMLKALADDIEIDSHPTS